MTGPAAAPVPVPSEDRASRAFEQLAEPVRRWIWQQGWSELRDVQEQAVPAILAGGDVILAARTAAGKTEAAFLPLLSRVLPTLDGGRPGFSVLYVSPLKALINDQFRRLESLLEACDLPLHRWHGDVSADAKRKARERPQGVVLITPESLEATLVRHGGDAPRLFGALAAIVIDELHAFVGTERGRQLQSVLSRIEVGAGRDRIDRIGLSATLGDMALAREALRPGEPDRVRLVESGEGGSDLLLQVRGYECPQRREPSRDTPALPAGLGARGTLPVRSEDGSHPASDEVGPIAEHLFEVLRGRRNLLFAGSRQNVEIYTDRLPGQKGGPATGPNPTDRGKPGTKRHLVTDARGTPLGLRLTAANWHDSPQMAPTLDAIPPVSTGRRGQPRRRPDKLHADKAYDAKARRQECRARGGSCRASPARASRAARGSGATAGSWILRQAQDEGTHAWFNRFRRLPIRYERRADIYEAFTSLDASLITLNQIRRFCYALLDIEFWVMAERELRAERQARQRQQKA